MKKHSYIKQHPVFTQTDDLRDICKPLNKLGINYFSHAQIDTKNQLTFLSTSPEFTELYLNKQYYRYDLHHLPARYDEQLILWDNLSLDQGTADLEDDFRDCQFGHTFSIIYNHGHSRDCFHFAAKLGDETINQQYLSLIDTLKSFILIFKDKINRDKAMMSAYDMPISLPKTDNGFVYSTGQQTSIDSPLSMLDELYRLYHNGSNQYLTKREFECLHWLSLGKTAADVAELLGMTERTVKAHVNNMKQKLQCYTQFQLGMVYQQFLSQLKYIQY